MLEEKVHSDWFFVVVLILFDGRVVTILISIRPHTATDSNITPAKSFRDIPMLRWERNRPTTKKFTDVTYISNFTLLIIAGCSQGNPGRARAGSASFFFMENPVLIHR